MSSNGTSYNRCAFVPACHKGCGGARGVIRYAKGNMKKISALFLLLLLSCDSEKLLVDSNIEGEFWADSLTITFRYADWQGSEEWVADVRYVYELVNWRGSLNTHTLRPAIPGNMEIWAHSDYWCYCPTPRDTMLVKELRIPLMGIYDYSGLDSVEVFFSMSGEFYKCMPEDTYPRHVRYLGSFTRTDTVMAAIEQPL